MDLKRRYADMKAQAGDALLLFPVGDFYELFFDDATVAAKTLGITLTIRDKGTANPTPMAGFPHQVLDGHLRRLLEAGHRVAVCEIVKA